MKRKVESNVIPFLYEYLMDMNDLFKRVSFCFTVMPDSVLISSQNTTHRFEVMVDLPREITNKRNPESQKSWNEVQFLKGLQDYFLFMYYMFEYKEGDKTPLRKIGKMLMKSNKMISDLEISALRRVGPMIDKLVSHIQNMDELDIKRRDNIYKRIISSGSV